VKNRNLSLQSNTPSRRRQDGREPSQPRADDHASITLIASNHCPWGPSHGAHRPVRDQIGAHRQHDRPRHDSGRPSRGTWLSEVGKKSRWESGDRKSHIARRKSEVGSRTSYVGQRKYERELWTFSFALGCIVRSKGSASRSDFRRLKADSRKLTALALPCRDDTAKSPATSLASPCSVDGCGAFGASVNGCRVDWSFSLVRPPLAGDDGQCPCSAVFPAPIATAPASTSSPTCRRPNHAIPRHPTCAEPHCKLPRNELTVLIVPTGR